MKRVIGALLCAFVLLCTFALSEGSPGDSVNDSIVLQLDGQSVSLEFDRSEAYSSIVDGNVQASFFAYRGTAGQDLYEVYMIFPEDVHPGDVITPEYAMQNAPESSVVLITTIDKVESYYFAGQVDGAAFPGGSGYGITIDSITDGAAGTTYAGRLTATLVGMDMDIGMGLGNIDIVDAPFSFTMPSANRKTTGENPFNPAPSDTPDTETPEPWDGVNPFAVPENTPAPVPETTPRQTWRI